MGRLVRGSTRAEVSRRSGCIWRSSRLLSDLPRLGPAARRNAQPWAAPRARVDRAAARRVHYGDDRQRVAGVAQPETRARRSQGRVSPRRLHLRRALRALAVQRSSRFVRAGSSQLHRRCAADAVLGALLLGGLSGVRAICQKALAWTNYFVEPRAGRRLSRSTRRPRHTHRGAFRTRRYRILLVSIAADAAVAGPFAADSVVRLVRHAIAGSSFARLCFSATTLRRRLSAVHPVVSAATDLHRGAARTSGGVWVVADWRGRVESDAGDAGSDSVRAARGRTDRVGVISLWP